MRFGTRTKTSDKALSDGPNALPLVNMSELLESIVAIDRSVKKNEYLEAQFGLGV